MKKIFMLMVIIGCTFSYVNAQTKVQTSPFRHIPKPTIQSSLLYGIVKSNKIDIYRFVLPFAGYSILSKQISTGIGYGWNRMHWIDSTQSYYTDFSIFGAIFVNGNTTTPSPYNFTSVGVGIGILNDLIMIVPAYTLPATESPHGKFDLKISFGLTLK